MAKKRTTDYFQTFEDLADHACHAADLLYSVIKNYSIDDLPKRIEQMHALEHAADQIIHKMAKGLVEEFITPIEREDILAVANTIDDLIDAIEDVLMRMYMCNIPHVREDAIEMVEVVAKCCNTLKLALVEFRNFKRSKTLHDLIARISQLEEKGDRLYTQAVRELYLQSSTPLEVMAWDRTYYYVEQCYDACENVGRHIEGVILKNT